MADTMNEHLDEGTIHAWLDGALTPDESERVERHAASCAACGEAVAEARGLVAASSRILSSLDDVAAGVIPGTRGRGDQLAALRARREAARPRPWWRRREFAVAASLVLVAGTWSMALRRGVEQSVDGVAPVAGMVRQAADSQPGSRVASAEAGPGAARDARVGITQAPVRAPSPSPSSALALAKREAGDVAGRGAATTTPPANEARRDDIDAGASRAATEMARQQAVAQNQAMTVPAPQQQAPLRLDSLRVRQREADRRELGLAARTDAASRAGFLAAKAVADDAVAECYAIREVDLPEIRVLGVPEAIRLVPAGDTGVTATVAGTPVEGLTLGARFVGRGTDLVELVVRRPVDSTVVRFSRSVVAPAPALTSTERSAGVKVVAAARIVCP